jgi:DNA-binding transcriptional MerR regulator
MLVSPLRGDLIPRARLLEPAELDPFTGHRHYAPDQIPTAHVVRRFRSLDIPLKKIHAVVTTAGSTSL